MLGIRGGGVRCPERPSGVVSFGLITSSEPTSVLVPGPSSIRIFHQPLHRASHNDILIRLLECLLDRADRYRRLGLDLPPGNEPRTRALQEHHQFVALIVDGHAAEAGQLMRGRTTDRLTATAISAPEDHESISVR
ncbi:FCD domain-containing protein [Streptomyces sp. NPDC002962]|uniref:FCD domain-containing protein n=1 Tax=Streptomyces sp. NPDC002962 TaxID=3364674 RepID=UPI00367F8A5E